MNQLASVFAIIGVLIACAMLFGFFSENFVKREIGERLGASHCKCSPLNSNIFVPKNKYRVVNGTLVKDPKDFPYTAAFLMNKDKPMFYCTGSVITPSYVLTAAHCLVGLNEKRSLKDKIIVASGLDHDLNKILKSNDNIRNVKNTIIHSGYVPYGVPSLYDSDSDIGLAELDRPFEFNQKTKIAPACLYGLRDYNLSYLVQAGYGRTKPSKINEEYEYEYEYEYESNEKEPNKDYYKLPELRMMYYEEFSDYDSYLRIKSDRSATCEGDSGSGVGHVDSNNRFFLIGILSSGTFEEKDNETYDCLPGSEDMFVSIQYFMDFILYNVEDVDNLCHTRTIITDRSKVLIYWLVAGLIIIIIGVFLFFLFGIKIEKFNLSQVQSLVHLNKSSSNPNQQPFYPSQPPLNSNQLKFDSNHPPLTSNQQPFEFKSIKI